MKDLFRRLYRRRYPYKPLITVEISRSRILRNYEAFRKMTGKAVAPVLKANAYGHGIFEVASILERGLRGDIPFFVVDSYFEAVALRAKGFRTPILVIGYTRPETMAGSRLKGVAFAVTSLDTLYALAGTKPPCPEDTSDDADDQNGYAHIPRFRDVHIHLKIDTGMRRQGILPEEAEKAIELMKNNRGLAMEGICTHFSDADNDDPSFTEKQIGAWNKAVRRFRAAFPGMRYTHAAATDGSAFSADIEADVVRLGIGLYGLSQNRALASKLGLQPALRMESVVSGVKRLKAGETVGYGNSFSAQKDTTIATVPVGYFEGLDRRMSSGPRGETRGWIAIGDKGIQCPIIGRVSMNITIADVSAVPDAKAGDNAVIFSDEPSDKNSISSAAEGCGTISYEIAVRIPAHLKRVVVD